jgi:hypothetical protein
MRTRCIEVALAELEAVGIRDVVVAHGSKHPQLRFKINGGPLHVFAVPGTPSDHRSPANTRRDLRRLLRDAGVLSPPKPKSPPAKTPDRITLLEQRVTALEQTLAKLLTPAISREVIPAAGEPEKSPSNGRSCHHGKN